MTDNFIFFPFTHITQHQLKTLFTFFSSARYLPVSAAVKGDHPLTQFIESGRLHPVLSSPGEIKAVEEIVKQYLAWAQIHKGNDHDLKSLLKDNPYFTSDTQVTAIKSQIKAVQQSSEAVSEDDAVLKKAMLFLKMAHLCDQQNERIDLELETLDKNRGKLVSQLRGLEDSDGCTKEKSSSNHKDPGAMMTRERIASWAACMAQTGGLENEKGTPLLVTTSQAVFDYLESNCKDVVNALDIDTIKVHENECENESEWRHHFCSCVMDAIQGDGNRENALPNVNDGCSITGQIKVGLFSGNDINNLFKMTDDPIRVCLIKLK